MGARRSLSFREAKRRAVERFERRFVERLLSETSGNISEAARRAGMDRNYLRLLIQRYASRVLP